MSPRTPPEPLTEAEVGRALRDLPGWNHEDDALRRRYRFGSFREAISFIVRIAFEAEQRDHHPELHNVWATVDVVLRTHEAGNVVTARDVELARAIQRISWVG